MQHPSNTPPSLHRELIYQRLLITPCPGPLWAQNSDGQSLLCPFSAHWSAGLCSGQEWLAQAPQRCGERPSQLLVKNIKCIPVTYRSSMAKMALPILILKITYTSTRNMTNVMLQSTHCVFGTTSHFGEPSLSHFNKESSIRKDEKQCYVLATGLLSYLMFCWLKRTS